MATTRANVSLSGATNEGTAVVLFGAPGDQPCTSYYVYNRDSTNYVRVRVNGCHNAGEDGASVPPGQGRVFRAGSQLSGGGITKVIAWAESGSPSVDGYVGGNL